MIDLQRRHSAAMGTCVMRLADRLPNNNLRWLTGMIESYLTQLDAMEPLQGVNGRLEPWIMRRIRATP